ncbi:SDR family NAD(P)-dependent oxidoreductase [Streptomyces sp. STR69]|uniref:SDR family NAD(P)-dependent oxidoreductase n=1 Tax=Streptomyces sp. STR69 TaxID=1796942 RepID=UPI0021CABE3B|nr:SDR family NAD(P)-dependent oxidoreductase [Streptomyces sp. STR69]
MGPVLLVTRPSSGIGASTTHRPAEHGASVTLVTRRKDRLDDLAAEIEKAGGSALAVGADITDPAQAEAAVQRTVDGATAWSDRSNSRCGHSSQWPQPRRVRHRRG